MEAIVVRSAGIHHITGIAGSPRRNVGFYTRVLGPLGRQGELVPRRLLANNDGPGGTAAGALSFLLSS